MKYYSVKIVSSLGCPSKILCGNKKVLQEYLKTKKGFYIYDINDCNDPKLKIDNEIHYL